jgi:formylglycine-generating enzyme required for sulfatase activity
MAFSFKLKGGVALYGAYAAIAAAAFAVAFAVPSIGAASAAVFGDGPASAFDNLNRSRPLAALGSERQCERYSGLPARWRDDPQAGMVHLHGGDFVFGSKLGYEDERPASDGKTHVAGFWIDQTDVTNAPGSCARRATSAMRSARAARSCFTRRRAQR